MISIQNMHSSVSSSTVPILAMKSAGDLALQATNQRRAVVKHQHVGMVLVPFHAQNTWKVPQSFNLSLRDVAQVEHVRHDGAVFMPDEAAFLSCKCSNIRSFNGAGDCSLHHVHEHTGEARFGPRPPHGHRFRILR